MAACRLSPKLAIVLEFVVLGTPVPDRQRLDAWKQRVQLAASQALQRTSLPTGALSMQLTHYFDRPPEHTHSLPASPAIAHPIIEVLQSLLDDRHHRLIEWVSRQQNLNGSFRLRGLSLALAEGFCSGEAFVHVRLERLKIPESPDGYTAHSRP
ncbi:MAG: hypothetical protein AAFQ57_05500 [Cyanobacteria bacterium J06626_14]